jgi:phosphotransferase system  glucose/maltose/N-acetylglucosamine-specific IIC component
MDKIIKLAQSGTSGILPTNSPTEWDLNSVVSIIGNLLGLLISLAGVVAVIFIIVGGIKYATSYGNPQTMESAKQTLLWAVIGLVIVVCSYTIARFLWIHFTGDSPFFLGNFSSI